MNQFPNYAEHCEWQNTQKDGFRRNKIEILTSYTKGDTLFYTAKIYLSRWAWFKTESKEEIVERSMCITPGYPEMMEKAITEQIANNL